MTLDQFITALHSIFGLLMLWALLYFGVREYRIDSVRQRLFILGDELFDYAAEGKVDFSDPAYGRLRTLVNSLIRFAHKLTFTQLMFATIAGTYCPPGLADRPHHRLIRSIDALPSEEAKAKLQDIHRRAAMAVIRHMLVGSPLMFLYVTGYILWAIVVHGAKHSMAALPPIDRLEDEAMQSESDCMQPAVA